MNLHSSASVTYETSILENGVEIARRAPKKNLLLDSGLDGWAVRTFWDSFSHCVLGDGTAPTKRDSGAITATIAGEVATASAGFFDPADVGRLLKLDSGQEVKIDGYTSATVVSVTGAADDAAAEFTIWYVNDTGHESEIVRTDNLSNDAGDVEGTWDGATATLKRTFIFPAEVGAVTYREIGWSHTAAAGPNLLGRDLIPAGGDSVGIGQQYKVVVKLQIAPTGLVPTAVGDIGAGFDTSGQAMVTQFSFGSQNQLGAGYELEPAYAKTISLISSDFALPAGPVADTYDAGNALAYKVTTAEAYVTGSFKRVKRVKFEVTEGNGTIRGIGYIGTNQTWAGHLGWAQKFTTPLVKDSDHTLELKISHTWGRTLVN